MSGRIWLDLCFQHVADQSNAITTQIGYIEGSHGFFSNFVIIYKCKHGTFTHIFEQRLGILLSQTFSCRSSSAVI